MKVTLLPANFQGSLAALAVTPDQNVTPVETVLERVSKQRARLVHVGSYNIVIDIEPGSLDQMMPGLRGWMAETEHRTNNVSAYEGTLAYQFPKK